MVYPSIYRVSTIQGGAGFLPSTVRTNAGKNAHLYTVLWLPAKFGPVVAWQAISSTTMAGEFLWADCNHSKQSEICLLHIMSMDWFRGKLSGRPGIEWENRWFPVSIFPWTNPLIMRTMVTRFTLWESNTVSVCDGKIIEPPMAHGFENCSKTEHSYS